MIFRHLNVLLRDSRGPLKVLSLLETARGNWKLLFEVHVVFCDRVLEEYVTIPQAPIISDWQKWRGKDGWMWENLEME